MLDTHHKERRITTISFLKKEKFGNHNTAYADTSLGSKGFVNAVRTHFRGRLIDCIAIKHHSRDEAETTAVKVTLAIRWGYTNKSINIITNATTTIRYIVGGTISTNSKNILPRELRKYTSRSVQITKAGKATNVRTH